MLLVQYNFGDELDQIFYAKPMLTYYILQHLA